MIWDLLRYAENTALVQGDITISYRQLESLSREIAKQIPERTLAFVLCTNSIGSIAGYLGLVNHKIVPLLLDAAINHELLIKLIETYEPSYIWAPSDMQEKIQAYDCIYEKAEYSMFQSANMKRTSLFKDLAVLISTSGSTGSPKLVRQTYTNILSNTKSIIEFLSISSSERAITSLPMNYVYGLSVVNTHLYAGATLILTNLNCYSNGFWELFRTSESTSFAGVPFMYEMLDKLKFTSKVSVPSLRYMTQAGGKLSPDLQKKFSSYAKETGRRFIVMYGASEATARMGYLPMEYALYKEGSMGIAIPGGRFELIDENDSIISEPGRVGELVYYGPNVTLGYAEKKEDLSKEDENHGRLLTGDMAKFDDDGFYYIVGRKARFIKVLGKRVNLDELERMLKREFNSIDIACAGRDDLLGVFVVDKSIADNVQDFIFHMTDINRKLIKVSVIEKIPQNSSGKTQYNCLNEMM